MLSKIKIYNDWHVLSGKEFSVMKKVILITGATDGIGLETAKFLVTQGHHVIAHGRNQAKLEQLERELNALGKGKLETILADLSSIQVVDHMVTEVAERFGKLDILINNAGVFVTDNTRTLDGLDVRFAVNTIAPYVLTEELLPLFDINGRIINLSSAAQKPVDIDALHGNKSLSANDAYAQSKLALTMWSRSLGLKMSTTGPMIVSVNPKSFIGTKMAQSAYGIEGESLDFGVNILLSAALSDEFNDAHGAYYDNDIEVFAQPHPDALNQEKLTVLIEHIKRIIADCRK